MIKFKDIILESNVDKYKIGNVRMFTNVDTDSVIRDPSLMRFCYENARTELIKRLKKNENVVYFLGRIKSKDFPSAINHGWIVKDDNIVIDPTPTFLVNKNMNEFTESDMVSFKEASPDIKYVGIQIATDFILNSNLSSGLGPNLPNNSLWDEINKTRFDD